MNHREWEESLKRCERKFIKEMNRTLRRLNTGTRIKGKVMSHEYQEENEFAIKILNEITADFHGEIESDNEDYEWPQFVLAGKEISVIVTFENMDTIGVMVCSMVGASDYDGGEFYLADPDFLKKATNYVLEGVVATQQKNVLYSERTENR